MELTIGLAILASLSVGIVLAIQHAVKEPHKKS